MSTSVYRPHHPDRTLLHEVLSQDLETWLARKREACPWDDPIPRHVERSIREYLHCGIPGHGFARVKCTSCKHEYVLAFSCKTRHLCPSCGSRRMASIAANLVDNVLPRVPVRQWVLSLPRRLRFFLVHDERMARRIHSIFLRAIHTRLRRSCPDAHSSFGAIGWYHRFGAYINRHPHFHDVVTDGVFSVSHKEIVFHEADLTDRDISIIQHQVRTRILRCLYRSGCIDASTREDLLAWEHGGGFSVDASVHVPAWDRAGLERLLRYCARPSFSLTRLFRIDDSHIGYTPKKPTMDGRSYIVFTHFQLIDAITALIPPPRVNSHSYFGAFAPNSSMRPLLHAAGPSASLSSRLDQASKRMGNTPRSEWARTWAMLMARIFEILPLVCTRCGAEMKIISFITEPEQIHRILSHVGINPDPPPPAPARDPPQGRLDFDQAPEDYDQSQEAPDD